MFFWLFMILGLSLYSAWRKGSGKVRNRGQSSRFFCFTLHDLGHGFGPLWEPVAILLTSLQLLWASLELLWGALGPLRREVPFCCSCRGTVCHLSPVTFRLRAFSSHLSALTFHLSPVTYHLSPITSHLSPVTCYLSLVTLELSPGTSHPWHFSRHISPLADHMELIMNKWIMK